MREREIAGGGPRGKVLGVCAVCRVNATKDHWRTESHREAAAAWERRQAREREAAEQQ